MMDALHICMLRLQSRYMRGDPATQAYCAALDRQLQAVAREARRVLLLPNVDSLPGDVLDALAWQMHTDGYNAMASLEERRRLVKSSIRVHRYKGTAYAVLQLARDVYGDAAEVLEWFDYGGRPYRFRVHIDCTGRVIGLDDTRRALALIAAGKNVRSVLEAFVFVVRPCVRNVRRFGPRSISVALAANALGIVAVRLNGMRQLDGTWPLAPVFTRTLKAHAAEFRVRVQNARTARITIG